MQAEGFFGSLFDYSFSAYITPRIIKVLYVLTTVVVALWTAAIVLLAFRDSTGLGLFALIVAGPIFFVIAMIYVRVGLEFLMVIFRIHEDVDDINRRGAGSVVTSASPPPEITLAPAVTAPTAQRVAETAPVAVHSPAPEPAPEPPAPVRFCHNCGTERRPGKGFCTACGAAID